jgi:hypothetical protein
MDVEKENLRVEVTSQGQAQDVMDRIRDLDVTIQCSFIDGTNPVIVVWRAANRNDLRTLLTEGGFNFHTGSAGMKKGFTRFEGGVPNAA